MTNAELLQILSGCRFYRQRLRQEGNPLPRSSERAAAEASPGLQRTDPSRARIDEVFRSSCRVMVGGLAASTLLLVLPLWLVHPPYGKACLLSLPPMLLCALSWTAAARWAWDRDIRLLMAVTMGAMPVRMALLLSWAWLVLTIPGVAKVAFVVGMMWHWAIFSVPEFAMLIQLSRQPEKPGPPAERFRLRRYGAGRTELVGTATRPGEDGAEVLRQRHDLEDW